MHNEQLSGYKFHLVLGAFEPDVEEIKKLAEKHTQICIYQNVKKMSELMQQCDMLSQQRVRHCMSYVHVGCRQLHTF